MENSLHLTRLPKTVRPVNYKLKLHPDLETGKFKGNVNIEVVIKEQTKSIRLHTRLLEITNVKVFQAIEEIHYSEYFEDKEVEQLIILFYKFIFPGYYRLLIEFNGDLTRNCVALYLTHLKNNRKIVASSFNPTYARQAFPCFDEPEFKASYDVTLVKPPTHIALSNMYDVVKYVDKETKLESVTFATSVRMSTYLTCFVICDFDYKEVIINSNGIGRNFRLRTFAQKDQMHKIDFGLSVAKRATEFYIQYYEVEFPLPKLDLIAMPETQLLTCDDWGLITYRETAFLIDPATASASNKFSVANLIAHGLAHMWFGNLVTMKWWDDLWLNEGFTVYMQSKALDVIEPTWSVLHLFLTNILHKVLVIDSKLTSHPIVMPVDTPEQIIAIEDLIIYNKGASILRMLEGFVGAESFRRGVSKYLKEYKFDNTNTQDLLDQLEPYFEINNSSLSLTHVMNTWMKQMGYPVLKVSRDVEPNTYVITQQRFLTDPDAVIPNDSPYNYRWFVPITYITNIGSSVQTIWFPDTADNVKLVFKEEETWVKLNNNQVGYYRVNYSNDLWNLLIEELKKKSQQLTKSDRAHLLNDVFALADADQVSYEIALNLSSYLIVEEAHVPWTVASNIFFDLKYRLAGTKACDDLQVCVQRLLMPLYSKQSWKQGKTEVIDRLLRRKILKLAMRFQLPEAVENCRSLFLEWLNKQNASTKVQIEPDLRYLVYYFGVKSATPEEWEKLWQVYKKEEDAQELRKLRRALCAPSDVNILKRFLDLAWEEENVRRQDFLMVLQWLSANPSGTDLVWDFVRESWPRLVDRFTLNSRYLGNMIPIITSHFNTQLKLNEMREFFESYPSAGAGEAARRRALETVAHNIRWARSSSNAVKRWLYRHVKASTNALI